MPRGIRALPPLLPLVAALACDGGSPSAQSEEATSPLSHPCISDTHGSLAVLQGATTPHVTQFNVLVPAEARLFATITHERDTHPIVQGRFTYPNASCDVVRINAADLLPGHAYELTLRVEMNGAEHIETRLFSTLAPRQDSYRFAIGTCMNDETVYSTAQKNIYRALSEVKPDFFIIGGDAVYVDAWEFWPDGYAPGGGDIWRRYTESWLALDLYHLPHLTPTVATWDDHDFGINDGTREFALSGEARLAFTAFFGANAIPGTDFAYQPAGLGVAAVFRAYGDTFLLLDNRSFREPPGPGDTDHWGPAQTTWAEEVLATHDRVWVVSGNQFTGHHHEKESMSGSHPAAYTRFLDHVALRPEGSVTLLSGDTHTTEVQRIEHNGATIHEFTVSPLHSRITAKHIAINGDRPNPLRLKHPLTPLVDLGAQVENFALFEATAGQPDFSFTMVDQHAHPILPPVAFPPTAP